MPRRRGVYDAMRRRESPLVAVTFSAIIRARYRPATIHLSLFIRHSSTAAQHHEKIELAHIPSFSSHRQQAPRVTEGEPLATYEAGKNSDRCTINESRRAHTPTTASP